MPEQVGKIPEFTTDESVVQEEVKEEVVETPPEKETETPTELPAEEKPAEEAEKPQSVDDELARQIQGLEQERTKLLKEIKNLRGERREIKQQEISKVESKIDKLEDVHPDDVSTIDKVLRSKGYITKEEAKKMSYEAVKEDELAKFLEKYPEYKPENDPNDLNWSAFQREWEYYRMPEDARRIGEILERVHRSIAKPADRSSVVKKRQIEVAGVGSGGTQRSSSKKSLESWQKDEYRRGGWSEEEIAELEKNLE